jgi:hypothetical protein
MPELSINTPALLFPAITLLMLAYTNRFLSLAALVRSLHEEYMNNRKEKNVLGQIKNIRGRINLIRYMQFFGVLSFFGCVLSMYFVFDQNPRPANWVFAGSLAALLVSILLSLVEIQKSTISIELELSDIEELEKMNIIRNIFDKDE